MYLNNINTNFNNLSIKNVFLEDVEKREIIKLIKNENINKIKKIRIGSQSEHAEVYLPIQDKDINIAFVRRSMVLPVAIFDDLPEE